MKIALAALLAVLAGCGPIRTAGTEDKSASELTLLRVPGHHQGLGTPGTPAHLNGIDIDNVRYELDGGVTEFLLVPGRHEFILHWEECIHWPRTWWFHFNLLGPSDAQAPSCPPLEARPGRQTELHFTGSGRSFSGMSTATFKDVP